MRHLCRWTVLALAVFAIACGGAGSGSDGSSGDEAPGVGGVLLRWRATSGVAGYVIHWGMESGAYGDALDVGAPPLTDDGVVSFLLEDATVSGTIFFALTSYDAEGRMSAFSNELAATVP